jgi:hypothetical protein
MQLALLASIRPVVDVSKLFGVNLFTLFSKLDIFNIYKMFKNNVQIYAKKFLEIDPRL